MKRSPINVSQRATRHATCEFSSVSSVPLSPPVPSRPQSHAQKDHRTKMLSRTTVTRWALPLRCISLPIVTKTSSATQIIQMVRDRLRDFCPSVPICLVLFASNGPMPKSTSKVSRAPMYMDSFSSTCGSSSWVPFYIRDCTSVCHASQAILVLRLHDRFMVSSNIPSRTSSGIITWPTSHEVS